MPHRRLAPRTAPHKAKWKDQNWRIHMNSANLKKISGTSIALATLVSAFCAQVPAQADQTVQYKCKEGFERPEKDIVNTLKDNDVDRFTKLQEYLPQAFDLDNTLKNKGQYTYFAANDKAWGKIPYQDQQSLVANKKKLKEVMTYSIVEGKLSADAIKKMSKLKTMEGEELNVRVDGDKVYINKALVTISDVPCVNGTIHIVDTVLMPKLKQ